MIRIKKDFTSKFTYKRYYKGEEVDLGEYNDHYVDNGFAEKIVRRKTKQKKVNLKKK